MSAARPAKRTGVVNQDVMRGVRWGALMLLGALLAVFAFRVWTTSATAHETPAAVPAASSPATEEVAKPAIVARPEVPPSQWFDKSEEQAPKSIAARAAKAPTRRA